MSEHIHDDQLLERLYGIDTHPHVDSCPECSARYEALVQRKQQLAAPLTIPTDLLAKQRAAILARAERPSLRWIPALATAAAIAIGFVMYQPSPAPRQDPGDEQLFADVYSMSQSTEARAGAPIHALFEDNQ
jgi:hypothetical protein